MGRRPVKPLRVVDQTEEAVTGRHLRNEGEDRDRDQKGIITAAGSKAECGAERCVLRRWQRGKLVQHWIEQLMQRGEGQRHLRLNTSPAKYP